MGHAGPGMQIRPFLNNEFVFFMATLDQVCSLEQQVLLNTKKANNNSPGQVPDFCS